MNVRVVVLSCIALGVPGCAAPPTAPPAAAAPAKQRGTLSDDDRNGFVVLVLGPKDNPVKACSVFALRHNTGLMLMRMGKATDDAVVAKLKEGVAATDIKLAAVRDQEATTWRETHNPGQLALLEFEHCERASGINADLGALGTTCFSLAAVPATVEGYKAVGMTQDKATLEIVRAFQPQLPGEYLKRVVADVYSKDASTTQYEAHRRVLATCVHDTH